MPEGIILRRCPPCFLRQALSLAWHSPITLGRAASEPWDTSVSNGIADIHHHMVLTQWAKCFLCRHEDNWNSFKSQCVTVCSSYPSTEGGEWWRMETGRSWRLSGKPVYRNVKFQDQFVFQNQDHIVFQNTIWRSIDKYNDSNFWPPFLPQSHTNTFVNPSQHY